MFTTIKIQKTTLSELSDYQAVLRTMNKKLKTKDVLITELLDFHRKNYNSVDEVDEDVMRNL